jgi:hypothetical protein
MDRDGFIFYTESKNVIQTYFPEDKEQVGKVYTWDGTMASPRK